MGFGHRVYKNYDPRATVIKKLAEQVFEVTGKNPLLEIALEMERIALEDDYFVKRKLYPNVDFYSGLIYEAMGFHTDFFTVLFAIPRTAGWLAQWQELVRTRSRRSPGRARSSRGPPPRLQADRKALKDQARRAQPGQVPRSVTSTLSTTWPVGRRRFGSGGRASNGMSWTEPHLVQRKWWCGPRFAS